MSDANPEHPSRDELAAFNSGLLGDAEAARIGAHIGGCGECRAVLEAVSDDELIGKLRGAADLSDRVVRAAGSTVSPAAEGTSIPAELAAHPRYRIMGRLGAGGMGVVYKAEHRLMERVVALKVIGRRWTGNPAAVARFRREVKPAARLTHPNLVTAHDAERAGDLHFLVMEYVEGTDLARLVEEHGPLPVSEACECIRQAAAGLQHAHEHGMVHRDIKPQNLMRTPQGRVKILDFGLASFKREVTAGEAGADHGEPTGGSLTGFGTGMGTPDYMAPEQAEDPHAADIRADIFGLGCTLVFLLTGRSPFTWGGGQVPDGQVLTRLSEGLGSVVVKMTAREPGQRFQTPAEVIEAITLFTETREPRTTSSSWWMRKRAVIGMLVLAAGVGGVCLSVWHGHRGQNRENTPPLTSSSPSGPVVVREVRCFRGHAHPVGAVAISPDGRFILSGSTDKTARLWDIQTGEQVGCWQHPAAVFCVAFSGDGSLAVTGSIDSKVRLWDVKTSQERHCLTGHTGPVNCVLFSLDGRRLVSGSNDATIRIWEAEGGRQIHLLRGHTDPVYTLAFSRDGRRLVSGSGHSWDADLKLRPSRDSSLRIWDAETGAILCQFDGQAGHFCVVRSALFLPDGRHVLSAGFDRSVRLWDVDGRKQERRVEAGTPEERSLALSPDGRHLLTGDPDKLVRQWDTETGRELAQFEGHEDSVVSVGFSRDGTMAVSGSQDSTVRLWRIPVSGFADE